MPALTPMAMSANCLGRYCAGNGETKSDQLRPRPAHAWLSNPRCGILRP